MQCGDRFTLLKLLNPRQYGRHFTDDIFKCIFLDENFFCSSNEVSVKHAPWGQIYTKPTLFQIMA